MVVVANPWAFPEPRRRFSAAEFAKLIEAGILGDDEHVELLDGELVVVSRQGPPHADAATTLHGLLFDAYRGAGVQVRDDKPLELGSANVPSPDLAVVRGARGAFATRHPRGEDTLLAVELAYTSLAFDRAKARVYAAGGVPCYWLVDVQRRTITVHTEPDAGGHYASIVVHAEQDAVSVPGTDARICARDFLP